MGLGVRLTGTEVSGIERDFSVAAGRPRSPRGPPAYHDQAVILEAGFPAAIIGHAVLGDPASIKPNKSWLGQPATRGFSGR